MPFFRTETEKAEARQHKEQAGERQRRYKRDAVAHAWWPEGSND